ncbi:Gfo/Idh/MocA family protein [Thermoleptolyngbya sp.]
MDQMRPIRVGIVGTGYAAKTRAELVQADDRTRLVAIASRDLTRAQALAAPLDTEATDDWSALVQRSDIDLVIVSTSNAQHAAVVREALQAGKHVVVEYPLALDLATAKDLAALAASQNCLLHVEHIELLSGIHEALQTALPAIGTPFYLRYSDLTPKHPAPDKWTYDRVEFGFPLVGALSRVHRLTNLFGPVKTVSCQTRDWQPEAAHPRFTTCVCTAQLRFASGLLGEVVYGKGEALWAAERTLTIQGETGAIALHGDSGELILPDQTQPLDLGSRRGLFARDTAAVLDFLTEGKPLYVSVADSLYALAVAEAAKLSAEKGEVVGVVA